MNWDAVGALAELGGAIGVVVTLIYLAGQIRTQNAESRLNAVSNLTAQYNAFLGDQATDDALAERFLRACEDLNTPNEQDFLQLSSRPHIPMEGTHVQNL
jgi:hypothetical protein